MQAACHSVHWHAQAIVLGIEAVDQVPGRTELIDEGQDFPVIVDCANNPKSLLRWPPLLPSITTATTTGSLWWMLLGLQPRLWSRCFLSVHVRRGSVRQS